MRQVKSVLLFFLISGLLISCDELLDQLDLTFTTGEQIVEFPAGPEDAGSHQFAEVIVTSELEKEIEDQGGSLDNLKSATVNSASISILSGADNLNAAASFQIWIMTMEKEEFKIAWVDEVPDGVSSVDLMITSESLKKFLELKEYYVVVKGVLDEDVKTELKLKATLTYDVKVGI